MHKKLMPRPWYTFHDYSLISPWYPDKISMLSPWYNNDIAIISTWYIHDFPMTSSYFHNDITIKTPWYPLFHFLWPKKAERKIERECEKLKFREEHAICSDQKSENLWSHLLVWNNFWDINCRQWTLLETDKFSILFDFI